MSPLNDKPVHADSRVMSYVVDDVTTTHQFLLSSNSRLRNNITVLAVIQVLGSRYDKYQSFRLLHV